MVTKTSLLLSLYAADSPVGPMGCICARLKRLRVASASSWLYPARTKSSSPAHIARRDEPPPRCSDIMLSACDSVWLMPSCVAEALIAAFNIMTQTSENELNQYWRAPLLTSVYSLSSVASAFVK